MEIVEEVLMLNDRLQQLKKLGTHCPKCDTQQVQIISHHKKPALWKCCECKHFFEFDIPRGLINAETGRFAYACPDLDQEFLDDKLFVC